MNVETEEYNKEGAILAFIFYYYEINVYYCLNNWYKYPLLLQFSLFLQ